MKIFRRRIIRAQPASVWTAISTVESLPNWMPGVQSAEHTGGPKTGLQRRQRVHKTLYKREIEVEQEVVWWEPESILSVRHNRETIGGRELRSLQDFVMTVTIAPADKGSRVVAQYEWKTRGFMPWLSSVLFAGRIMGRELRETLARIDKMAAG